MFSIVYTREKSYAQWSPHERCLFVRGTHRRPQNHFVWAGTLFHVRVSSVLMHEDLNQTNYCRMQMMRL
jgi:hypothetical protein